MMNQQTKDRDSSVASWYRKKRRELGSLKGKIDSLESSRLRNNDLKERIAWFCLNIVKKTNLTKMEIKRNSSLLIPFGEYDYGDLLDKVFLIAKEIKRAETTISTHIISQWERIRELLEEYLR